MSFQVLRNVFFSMLPSQKDSLSTGRQNLRPTFLTEEDVYRSQTREVEDVETVLDGDLNVGERVHLLDRSSGGHGDTDVQRLASVQHWNVERLEVGG